METKCSLPMSIYPLIYFITYIRKKTSVWSNLSQTHCTVYAHMEGGVHINIYIHMLYVQETDVSRICMYVSRGEWLWRVDSLVGHYLACILLCSSISLSPPNPLTLCLKISVIISLLSPSSCAAHSYINSSTNRWKNAHLWFTIITLRQRNAIQGLCVKFHVNWELFVSMWSVHVWGDCLLSSTHSNAESTEPRDERV